MLDFLASGHFGTGTKRSAYTGTSLVQEEGDPVRYAEDNKYKIILLTVFPFMGHTIETKTWHASRIMYEHLLQFNNNFKKNILGALLRWI
jgi:hypothetical protein